VLHASAGATIAPAKGPTPSTRHLYYRQALGGSSSPLI
jgi:hypothetical protein